MTIDLANCRSHVFLIVFTLHTSKTKHCMYLENMAYSFLVGKIHLSYILPFSSSHVCVCVWYAPSCVYAPLPVCGCLYMQLRLMFRTFLYDSSTLFFETESVNQIQNSPMRLAIFLRMGEGWGEESDDLSLA